MTEVRKTGIDTVGGMASGTHFCVFYETKQDLLDTLVSYFKAGLENKEFCVWVISEPLTMEEARSALQQAVPDFDQYLAEQRIEMLLQDEWYLKEGAFDLQGAINRLTEKLKQALARGCAGLRGSGSTAWLQKDWRNFREYEKKIDETIVHQRMTLLCTFPLATSEAVDILDAARTHQVAVSLRSGNWEVVETPERKQAKEEVKALNEELKQRIGERTRALAAANEALKREITERMQVEDELRKQKEILQKIFDNIPVMIRFLGADGRIKLVNREWERTIGWTLAEIQERNLDIYAETYPDPQYRQYVLNFIATSNAEWVDFKTQVRDGRVIDTAWANVHLSDGTRIGIGQDITERKKLEEEISLREQRLNAFFTAATAGLALVDTDLRYLQINDTLAQINGVPPREHIGRTVQEVLPKLAPVVDPMLRQVLATGQPILNVEITGETPSQPGIPRHWLGSYFPIAGKGGSPAGVGGIVVEITERKRAEEALQHSEAKFRQLAEHVNELFWMSNQEITEMLYVSPAYEKIWGRSCQSLYEHPVSFTDAIYPADRDHFLTILAKKKRGEETDEQYRIVRPDGSVRWIRARAFPVRNESGEAYRIVGVAEDITERKQAEDRLRANSQQLRALSASLQSAREEERTRIAREIHDELGSTLTSLKWDLEALDKMAAELDDRWPRTALREKMDTMIKLTDTTINAIRRIASELRPSLLDDLGLMEAIEWQAQQFQARTGIVCHCDCSLQSPDLNREQSTAVFRIFQEALTNILRHAQATRVEVTVEEKAGEFVLTIRDNGRGITEDEKSDQLSLGLLGMQERAHLVGGKVEIARVEEKGTIVTVRVPLAGAK